MPDKPNCFIVFMIPISNGEKEIRAICTEQWIANRYRKAYKNDPQILRCWVETREMNHLYGASMLDKLTSDEAKILIDRGFDNLFENKIRKGK